MISARHAISYGIRKVGINPGFAFRMTDGSKFRLSRHIESHSLWIENELNPLVRFVLRTLKPGQIFVDIGANIGRVTIPAARIPDVHVYAFEPSGAVAELNRNLAENRLFNVTVCPYVVAKQDGLTRFWDHPTHSHLSGLSRQLGDSESRLVRAVTPISVMRTAYPGIDLLKIDTEGYDFEILKGLGPRINEIPTIVFEASRDNLARFEYRISDVLTYLFSAGRKVYRIDGDELIELEHSQFDADNVDMVTTL